MNHRLHRERITESQITQKGIMNNLNNLTKQIIGLAINIHNQLGPGFGETIYKRALKLEIQRIGLKVQVEHPVIIKWKSQIIGKQKLDLLVNNTLIVELKSKKAIEDIHLQQLLSYLKASQKRLGIVLNFGAKSLQIKRVINTPNPA